MPLICIIIRFLFFLLLFCLSLSATHVHLLICYGLPLRLFIYFFFCAFLLCRMDRRFNYSTWNSGNDDPCNIAIYMCVETESCFPLGVLGVCETTTIAIAAYEWYNYSVIVSVFPLLLFFYSIIFYDLLHLPFFSCCANPSICLRVTLSTSHSHFFVRRASSVDPIYIILRSFFSVFSIVCCVVCLPPAVIRSAVVAVTVPVRIRTQLSYNTHTQHALIQM